MKRTNYSPFFFVLFPKSATFLIEVANRVISSTFISVVPVAASSPILLVIITLDMFISFSACIRMGLRHSGYDPITKYGEIIDRVYNDDRMKKSYTNMVVK